MSYLLKPSQGKFFCSLVKRLLLLNLRNGSALFSSLVFFLITIVTFHIGVGPTKLPQEISNGIIFCSLCFTLMLSSDRILCDDYKNGIIEELIVSGVKEYTILVSYLFCYSFIFFLAFALLLPIGHFIFNLDFDLIHINFLASILCIINASTVLLFIRLLIMNLRMSPMLAVLATPFLIPNLIVSILSIHNPSYMLISIGFLLIMLPITFFFSRLILEESL